MTLIKVSLCLLIILLISSCASMGNATDNQGIYTVEITTTELKSDAGNLEVYYPKISGLTDEALQARINEVLKDSATSWIDGKMYSGICNPTEILCQTPQYLCVFNKYEYNNGLRYGNRFYWIRDYITVDITDGKRVFLDDLADVSLEFARDIRVSNIVHSYEESQNFDGVTQNLIDMLNSMTDYEVYDMLIECSKTQSQIVNETNAKLGGSDNGLLFRDNFFIAKGELVIVSGDWQQNKRLAIDVEDISQYLKVAVW